MRSYMCLYTNVNTTMNAIYISANGASGLLHTGPDESSSSK